MTFVDSHCHLYADAFDEDRDEVLSASKKLGVQHIILPNIDIDSVEGMHELSKHYPDSCWSMMGLHPCSVKENVEEQLAAIKVLLDKNPTRYVGVGEIGIDLYWDKTFLEQQKHAFKEQCKWAVANNMPVAIHIRDSFQEIFACLDELNLPTLSGIFHCFTGNNEQAKKALSYPNFYLGIGGVVTFKNTHLRETLKSIVPKERLVLETDSPYLAPHPNRGKRNTPEYIPLVAETLAAVYDCSLEHVAEITTANCKTLFPQLPV